MRSEIAWVSSVNILLYFGLYKWDLINTQTQFTTNWQKSLWFLFGVFLCDMVNNPDSPHWSLSFAPPPDLFCSSHIVRPFLTLCDGSCTGSRCQIASSSNCVRWYTDACTDSLLTICPISAHPPRCTLSWDHLWHLNDRCLSPGRKPGQVHVGSTLLRPQPGTHSQFICVTLIFRWTVLKLNWKFTFFLDILTWLTLILLFLFVVHANVIVYKLARANVCIEMNWIEYASVWRICFKFRILGFKPYGCVQEFLGGLWWEGIILNNLYNLCEYFLLLWRVL